VATVSTDSNRLPDDEERGAPGLGYLGHLRGHPSVFGERRLAGEYLQLIRDPIFEGEGVPKGAGRPVMLIPGFLHGDVSLEVLRGWLERCGYQVEMSGIRWNIHYSEVLVRRLLLRLLDIYGWHGRKVTLVGHSRGGMLAAVLAQRHPEIVRRVVGLGSPLANPYDVHPVTMAGVRLAQAFNLVRYMRSGSVEVGFLRDLAAPVQGPVTSIYSRSDGIVYWGACRRPDVDSIEVEGSHLGLTVNRDVYAALARVLHAPVARQRGGNGTRRKADPDHLGEVERSRSPDLRRPS
jgi:triacylglycerol lipase